MIDFITSRVAFEKHRSMVDSLFRTVPFEDNPFDDRFTYFVAFEFDFVYHELFFEGLKKFSTSLNENTLMFYTVTPSPVNYYFEKFSKYSVFEISNEASDSELNHIMMKDPKGNSGNSICLTSDEFVWYSTSKNWAILASRDWELAIVGFSDYNLKTLFTNSFDTSSQTMLSSISDQVKGLNEMLNFDNDKLDKYLGLISRYRETTQLS